MGFKNIIRALRLSFITVSLFPVTLGSLLSKNNFNIANFLLGVVTVSCAHLSANLINDYADSRSGLDWRDLSFYQFFGGSKLIQEGVFSEKFYLRLSVFFALLSSFAVITLAFRLNSISIMGFYLIIILLAWLYSIKPVQFSYHLWGEVIIFILFGPALVMGGYFIQAKIFPEPISFLLSLPFGFLTTAILFSNEVPDLSVDKGANKLTWVSLTGGENAFRLYSLLMFLAFLCIGINIALGNLSHFAAVSFVLVFPAVKAIKILKKDFNDKIRLKESSKLTIAVHAFVSIILILGLFL